MTFLKRFEAYLGPVGVFSALTFGSLVGGCGAEGEPAMTRDEFCEEWADAACSSEVISVCQAASSGACKSTQLQACLDNLPNDFIDRGVDACLGAVKKAYQDADLTAEELDLVTRYAAPCNEIFVSNDEGERCSSDRDCEAALRCILKDDDRGTCEVPVIIEPGFSCSAPEETCEEEFFCDGNNCIAALQEGDDCSNDHQCGSDMYCEETCIDKFEVGDDCESDSQCRSGICYATEDSQTCVDRLRLSPAEPMCDSLK